MKVYRRKSNKFIFNSDTYNKLSDTETKLYAKNWSETYKLLLNELNKTNYKT